MIKVYKKLTKEQIKRDVLFSSCLSVERTEQEGDEIHEVLNLDVDKWDKIDKLRDDKFFNGSEWRFNIIRQ